MAACKYTEVSMAKRAITAALVGVLSVGTVPMVALATGTADDGIELQSVSGAQAFSEGALTYAHDNQGHRIDDLTNLEFTVGSDCLYPEPLQVTPKNADEPVAVSRKDVKYYTKSGREINPDDISQAGEYYMLISAPADSAYAGGKLRVDFRVVSQSLKSLGIFDESEGDVSDTTFTYTGEEQQIGFILDGKVLDKPTDFFSITYVNADDSTPVRGVPTEAGNYVARLEGKGEYKYSRVEIAFTINPLDLSTANVTMSDIQQFKAGEGMPQEAVVNGVTLDSDDLDITFAGSSNEGDLSLGNLGTYTANVTADPKSGNVTGSTQATFSVVKDVVFTKDLLFKGKTVGEEPNDPYYVLLEDIQHTAIDEDDFEVDVNIWNWWHTLGAKLDVTFTDAAGNEVSARTVNTTVGDYTVTVRVDAASNNYQFGSDALTMTIHTREDKIKANANLYFKLDGNIVDDRGGAQHVTYTGQNILDRVDTVLEYNGKALTAGTDYSVTVYRVDGFDGRLFMTPVDSITESGTYRIVVSSGNYMLEFPFEDVDLWLTVDPTNLNKVYFGSDDEKSFTSLEGSVQTFIPYTGNAASYYFYYVDGNNNEVKLDDGIIDLSHFYYTDEAGTTTDADEIVEVGTYRASVMLGAGVKNYDLNSFLTENTLEVRVANIFSDVPATAWYAEPIYQAKEQGYINGYAGTTLFGPEKNITRGDVACILFNMSGVADKIEVSEDLSKEYISYATGFNDVDGNAYYAKAIGWAAKLGIVNGYPDGSFKADQMVTTQEFACMLANYAKALGVDVDAAEADLANMPGGSAVSDYAVESMEWAVSEGVIGNNGANLDPLGNITRARVAAMCVNYQPEALHHANLL